MNANELKKLLEAELPKRGKLTNGQLGTDRGDKLLGLKRIHS